MNRRTFLKSLGIGAVGAAITVMKCYDGGKLLSASDSPFGTALTTAQCVQYCLDCPAVASCVAGAMGR